MPSFREIATLVIGLFIAAVGSVLVTALTNRLIVREIEQMSPERKRRQGVLISGLVSGSDSRGWRGDLAAAGADGGNAGGANGSGHCDTGGRR